MTYVDKLGIELKVEDFVCWVRGKNYLKIGKIIGFTKHGYPRVVEYYPFLKITTKDEFAVLVKTTEILKIPKPEVKK